MTLRTRLVWLCFSAPAIIACGDRETLDQRAAAPVAQRLSGTWDVRFELERSPRLVLPADPAARVVRGQLAFIPNRWLGRSYPEIHAPTDYGTYDIDFTPFGFESRNEGQTPTAVAGIVPDDSIQILLDPGVGRVLVTMRGKLAPDSVMGTWDVSIARVGGGGGKFTMLRQRDR